MSGRWFTQLEPVAVRNGRGPVHVAVPGLNVRDDSQGGRYLGVCGRIIRGPRVLVWHRRDAHTIWSVWKRCRDCERLADQAPTHGALRRVAGWADAAA